MATSTINAKTSKGAPASPGQSRVSATSKVPCKIHSKSPANSAVSSFPKTSSRAQPQSRGSANDGRSTSRATARGGRGPAGRFFNRRMKVFCIAIGAMLVVVLLAVCFTLIVLTIFATHQLEEDEPPVTLTIPLTTTHEPLTEPPLPTVDSILLMSVCNLTQMCMATEKVGFGEGCLTHLDKYVTDCRSTHCASVRVYIELRLIMVPQMWKTKIRYKPGVGQTMNILGRPDVPCLTENKENGFCRSGQCIAAPGNANLNKYAALAPIHGRYMPDVGMRCTKMSENARTHVYAFSGVCQGGTDCHPYSTTVMSCRDPLPQLGGNLCFNDKASSLPFYEVPIRVSICDSCVARKPKAGSALESKICPKGQRADCASIWFVVWLRESPLHEKSKQGINDDYAMCCLNLTGVPEEWKKKYLGKGPPLSTVCIGGDCLPVTPIG